MPRLADRAPGRPTSRPTSRPTTRQGPRQAGSQARLLLTRAAPWTDGTVAPSGEYNMSSFAGHNFITKRLAWSAAASTAATATHGGAEAVHVLG